MEKLLLHNLAANYNAAAHSAWPSVLSLAFTTGITPRHTQRLLASLQAKKLLEVIPEGGPFKTNAYVLPELEALGDRTRRPQFGDPKPTDRTSPRAVQSCEFQFTDPDTAMSPPPDTAMSPNRLKSKIKSNEKLGWSVGRFNSAAREKQPPKLTVEGFAVVDEALRSALGDDVPPGATAQLVVKCWARDRSVHPDSLCPRIARYIERATYPRNVRNPLGWLMHDIPNNFDRKTRLGRELANDIREFNREGREQ